MAAKKIAPSITYRDWKGGSLRLMRAANFLIHEQQSALSYAIRKGEMPYDEVEAWTADIQPHEPGFKLASLAIEAALKAAIEKRTPGAMASGKYRHHDLDSMAQELGIVIEDSDIWKLAQSWIEWKGRYPSSGNRGQQPQTLHDEPYDEINYAGTHSPKVS